MPKKERCPDCQGQGTIEIEGKKEKCFSCGGKGKTIRTGSLQTCYPCKGTGKVGPFKRCPRCQGAGYIYV